MVYVSIYIIKLHRPYRLYIKLKAPFVRFEQIKPSLRSHYIAIGPTVCDIGCRISSCSYTWTCTAAVAYLPGSHSIQIIINTFHVRLSEPLGYFDLVEM